MARPQHQQHLGALLALLATTYVACSGYDGSNRVSKPPQLIPDADYGGAPSASAGANQSGNPATGAGTSGAAGSPSSMAGAPSAGAAGTANSAGANSGGTTSAGANSGGTTSAGANSGGTTSAGSGGAPSAGAAGAGRAGAGAGGGATVEQLLSQGKPATADSEETGHLAALGNDGTADTRWCAANGSAGHYWQVDLGASYVLSKLTVTWEKAVVYQFKVEGSVDGAKFTSLLDQTQSTDAVAAQTYPLSTGPSARYVRITTTTLPTASIWASFFEFQVYGH